MTSVLIDAGNTSCKYAVSSGGRLTCFARDDGADMAATVRGMLRGMPGGVRPDRVVFSSVRGGARDAVGELRSLGCPVLNLDCRTPVPLTICYGTPESLGADRIAAAVGARVLFPGEDLLVFDFGTAVTIDRVTAEGLFAGGNISPGLRSRIGALHRMTASLPDVPLEDCRAGELGTTTQSALVCGAVSGTVFEVCGYINSYPGHKIVFSGGDSIFLAKKMKYPIFADYNLVLRGLAYIAEYDARM